MLVEEREIGPTFLWVYTYPNFNFSLLTFSKATFSNLNGAVGHHQPLDSDKPMKNIEFGPILILQGNHPIGIDY